MKFYFLKKRKESSLVKKKIALVQMNIAAGEVEQNYAHATELIETAAQQKPDIIVLPETWNTGFKMTEKLPQDADKNGERTQTMLSELAKKHDVNIVGGSVGHLAQR